MKNEIITLSVIAVSVLIMVLFTDADAVTSSELSDLNEKITIQKQKNHDMIDKLIEQREEINKLYDQAKKKNKEIQQTKATLGKSWNNFDRLEAQELELADINTEIQTLKEKYIETKQQKQEEYKKLKQLKDQYKKTQHQFYLERQKTLSGLTKVIGIRLDSTCETMIKNNINNGTCPTYNELIQLDSSLKQYSGDFVTTDNYTQREKSKYQNSWRFYNYDNDFRIVVDPPSGMAERIKTITIQPNFDTYLIDNNMVQKPEFELVDVQVNNTYSWIKTNKTIDVTIKNQTKDAARILYHDRYVNESCTKAVINAEKTKELLADTIHYMRSGCDDKQTKFNEKQIIPFNFTQQDITTSQKYKHDTWIQYVKDFCIFKFQSCN